MEPIPQKPVAAPVNSQWSEKPPLGGCLGCFLIALVGSMVVCAGMCGGGYYAVFHSSMPLAMIEDALEESGQVEIEGLSGSISRGFHIDILKFRTDPADDAKWSELAQIDFQFNGVNDLARNERLVIDKFTVGSGTVYYHPSADAPPTDSAPETPGETVPADAESSESAVAAEADAAEADAAEADAAEADAAEADAAEADDAATAEANDVDFDVSEVESTPFREVRIGLIEVKDLKIIDPETNAQSQVGRATFKNFEMLQGEMSRVGELDGEGIVLRDFTPRDSESVVHGAAPSHLTANLSFRRETASEAFVLTIAPDAKFQLGQTAFAVTTNEIRLEKGEPQNSALAAVAESDPSLTCRVYAIEESPYFRVELQRDGQTNAPDLVAQVLYGQSYDALSPQQRNVVDRTRRTDENSLPAAAQP